LGCVARFDLILSDFSLPAYDGMAALSAAHQAQPETPFLFVSGTIGEEKAVESLRAGATDYVLKDHLHRLAPAVPYVAGDEADQNAEDDHDGAEEFGDRAVEREHPAPRPASKTQPEQEESGCSGR